jgi:DNA polymerase-1
MIAHSAQFEHKWLLADGISARIEHDTKLMLGLYDNRLPLGLAPACSALEIGRVMTHGAEICTMQGQELADQNVSHTQATYRLGEYLWPRLTAAEKRVYREVLIPATKNVAQIELEGLCVDAKLFPKIRAEIEKRIRGLDIQHDSEIRLFNASSDKPFDIEKDIHKKIVLYDMMGYEVPDSRVFKTKGGAISVKGDILKYLMMRSPTPTLNKIIKHAQYNGWLNGFLTPMEEVHMVKIGRKHFIFTNLWIGETSTGRIKSVRPNLQNQPHDFFRRVFVSRFKGGYIVEWDYDGIELRIAAWLADDEIFLDAFDRGIDPHLITAQDIYGKQSISYDERQLGKKFNYSSMYLAGAAKLALETGKEIDDMKRKLDRFWRKHENLREYFKKLIGENEYGEKYVRSPTGMKRYFTKITEASNHPVQNTALVIILKAINQVVPFVKSKGGIIDLTIHDSIRSDMEARLKDKLLMPVKEIMEAQTPRSMPIKLTVTPKVGRNWYDMEDVKC